MPRAKTPALKHWSVNYYFTVAGNGKRQYKGTVCECFHACTKVDAIAQAGVTQSTMSPGNILQRVVATRQRNMGLCDAVHTTVS